MLVILTVVLAMNRLNHSNVVCLCEMHVYEGIIGSTVSTSCVISRELKCVHIT